MPFFQVDDQVPVNPKVKALVVDAEGLAAFGLWTLAGAQCQASLEDGYVSARDALRLLLDPDLVSRLSGRLVKAGLWHPAADHHCDRCPKDPARDGWLFHDWFDLRYDQG